VTIVNSDTSFPVEARFEAFPVEDKLILEAEAASTGKQEVENGTVLYVEFYTGKVKKNGHTTKTNKVYWQFAIYKGGKRQRRISPKQYLPDEFNFDGATSIDNCPYTGRVGNYWKKQGRSIPSPDHSYTGLLGSEAAFAEVMDSLKGREDLYLH
jgi:hypothetical protein